MLNAKFFCDRLVFFSTRVMFVGALVVSLLSPASAYANRLESAIQEVVRLEPHHALVQSGYMGAFGVARGDTAQDAIDAATQRCLNDEAPFRSRATGCQLVVLDGNYVGQPVFDIRMPVEINVYDAVSGNNSNLSDFVLIVDNYENRSEVYVMSDGREICSGHLRWRRVGLYRVAGYRLSMDCLGYDDRQSFRVRTTEWRLEFQQSTITVSPDF